MQKNKIEIHKAATVENCLILDYDKQLDVINQFVSLVLVTNL